MEKARALEHIPSFLYGDGNTSDKIIKIIKDYLDNNKIDLKKQFYNV